MAFKPPDEQNVDADVAEFALKLDRLRVTYEQYFLGIEKREPTVQLKDVVRLMRRLEGTQIKNTALRYRYRTLLQKFNSYRTYWNRTIRAIEAGTYHRDVARVQRRMARQGVMMPKASTLKTAGDVERAMAEAAEELKQKKAKEAQKEEEWPDEDTEPGKPSPYARQHQEQLPVNQTGPHHLPPEQHAPHRTGPHSSSAIPDHRHHTGPRRRPATTPAPGRRRDISDDQLRSLYRRFVKAKKMCGEDTSAVHYDSLAKTIRRQLPRIREMHGSDVDFQVVIRGGRAILKAKPK